MSNVEVIQENHNTGDKYIVLCEIMDQHGQAIQQLVFTYVKDYATAEDLTQEVFLKAFNKLHTFKQFASMKTWLYRIAINHCKDYLKSWHHRNTLLNTELIEQIKEPTPAADEKLIKQNENQRLVSAVLKLSLKYREAVYLYYYEELTTKEISSLTNENENTIKSRLLRAKQIIKRELQGGEG